MGLYTCCNISFTQADKLIFHLEYVHASHTFTCPIANCDRSFHKRAVFKKHLMIKHTFFLGDQANSVNSDEHTDINVDPVLNCKTEVSSVLQSSNSKCDHENLNINSSANGGVCVEDNSLNVKEYFDKYNSLVNSSVLTFVAKVYDNLTLPKSCVQFIVDTVRAFLLSGALNLIQQLIRQRIKINDENKLLLEGITNMLSVFEKCFDDLNTDYKRVNYFQKSAYFIKPAQYKIGNINDVSRKGNRTALVVKPLFSVNIPIVQNLKLFLELPDVLDKIIAYQHKLVHDEDRKVLKNLVHGTLWKSKSNQFHSQLTLPLIIYFDDLQVGNPLGSHATFTKVGVIYYTIPTIPPEYYSKLKNIFVAEVFHTIDRNTCGNRATFQILLEDLQKLENTGIVVEVNGNSQRIYFCVILIVGDNLGMHSMLGFSESFASNNYCRFCLGSKCDLKIQCSHLEELLRRKVDYENHVKEKLFGIKGRCIWNDLHFFHVYDNFSCDVMHDLLEGVHRYDMARILKCLISDGCFTIEVLNIRIKYTRYESNEKNILPAIKEDQLNNGYIVCSAAEMCNLVRNLRFIVGDLVPLQNKYWTFYLLLLKITNILLAKEISTDTIDELKSLIEQHHAMYIHLFQENLKPKQHFLLHYPHIIKLIGPVSLLSSIRFEAKHRELKTIANNTRSRVNIPLTIANRLQLQNCYRYLTSTGFIDTINTSSSFEMDYRKLGSGFHELLKNYHCIQWYEHNDLTYNTGCVLLYANEAHIPQFAKVEYIFINKDISSQILFYCKMYETLKYNQHYEAYLVQLSNVDTLISACNMYCKYPTIDHSLSSGIYVILPKNS